MHNANIMQVNEWHTKVGDVRMKELEQERMVTKLQAEVSLPIHIILGSGNSNQTPFRILSYSCANYILQLCITIMY